MIVRRGALNWGVFLILVGLIPLAVQQGWIPADAVRGAWRLWPIILIGLGLGLILARTALAALGGVIAAAILGVIVGGALATGLTGIGSIGSFVCGDTSGGQPVSRQGTFERAGVSVQLEFTCGRLTVQPGGGGNWQVISTDSTNRPPEITSSDQSLVVRAPDENVPFFGIGAKRTWDVTLPTERTVDLAVDLNAGSGSLNLAGLVIPRFRLGANASDSTLDLAATRIGDLRVQLNAGSVAVILPTAGLTGTIEGNAASVELCAPAGVGLRFRTGDNVTASNNYAERGLVQSGSSWTTPGYDAAAVKIDLRTTGNAISYVLDPTGGCR